MSIGAAPAKSQLDAVVDQALVMGAPAGADLVEQRQPCPLRAAGPMRPSTYSGVWARAGNCLCRRGEVVPEHNLPTSADDRDLSAMPCSYRLIQVAREECGTCCFDNYII